MRRGPVETVAPATDEEAVGALPDVCGHSLARRFARHRVESPVAVETAAEDAGPGERHPRGDLAKLVAEPIAPHDDVRRQLRIAWQPAVARQEEAAFAAGAGDEPPAAEMRAVGDVVSEHPQPAGEPTEHAVDCEAGGLAGRDPGFGHAGAL